MSAKAAPPLQDLRSAVVRALLVFYKRAVSPILHAAAPGACRFQPTCSEYAAIALAEHGVMQGGWMAVQRLLRCHPLHSGGFDPVPARRNAASCAGHPHTTTS